MAEKLIPYHLRLPEEDHKKVEAKAAKDGDSKAGTIRRIVRDWFRLHNK